jgi:hypothetical protein
MRQQMHGVAEDQQSGVRNDPARCLDRVGSTLRHFVSTNGGSA